MPTDLTPLYEAIDGTWPAERRWIEGQWTLRAGAGGGKRVSAATMSEPQKSLNFQGAETAMRRLSQQPLFMVRAGETALDEKLSLAGYALVDPVNIYAAPVDSVASETPPRLSAFDLWPPLAIQAELWAQGGIGPARLAVMARAPGPKTALFGRHDGRPSGTGFVAIHHEIAMIHALEVAPEFRRKGVGRNLTRHAAIWARAHNAQSIAVLCTRANDASNALFISMGFQRIGGYHYRSLKEGHDDPKSK